MFYGLRRFQLGRLPFAFALVSLVITTSSNAKAAPSWQSQPAWASDSDDAQSAATPVSKRKKRDRYSANAPTPFSPGSNNVALDVGQVFLMGGLNSKYSDSIGSQIHYTYGVSDLFGFDSSLGYSSHTPGTVGANGGLSMTTLLVGLRTNLAWYDRVVPYFVFGLGFYRPSYDLTQFGGLGSDSPVLFGVHMGPGVDLQLTNQLFFGASLTLHDAFGETTVTPAGPLSMGGTFTSFLVHAGMTF